MWSQYGRREREGLTGFGTYKDIRYILEKKTRYNWVMEFMEEDTPTHLVLAEEWDVEQDFQGLSISRHDHKLSYASIQTLGSWRTKAQR